MNQKATDYFNKQKSPQKEICQKLRKIIFKTFPGVEEEMRWGVPSYDDGRFYIAPVRHGVNLGFAIKGLDKEEMEAFEGTGKTMRHLKFLKVEDIKQAEVVKLLKLVKEKAECKGC